MYLHALHPGVELPQSTGVGIKLHRDGTRRIHLRVLGRTRLVAWYGQLGKGKNVDTSDITNRLIQGH